MVYAVGETTPGQKAPYNRKNPDGIGANKDIRFCWPSQV